MPSYSLVNPLLLAVQLNGEKVFARRGAMLANRGAVEFAPSILAGGGVESVAERAVTGEGFYLMTGTGTGEVLVGHRGKWVTIITLQDETLYVESDSVLAFDERLRTGSMFIGNQGLQAAVRGMMSGQGLFTTTFEGRGELAIISDGAAIGLPVTPEKPVFADPDAYLGHKGQLDSKIATDMGWKAFVGQGSGESFQLKFTGSGTVYIQASER